MLARISIIVGLTILLCRGVITETLATGKDASTDSTEQPSAVKSKAEILWDEFGIPHIYGPDLPTVVRGYGYAQMENHAEQTIRMSPATSKSMNNGNS